MVAEISYRKDRASTNKELDLLKLSEISAVNKVSEGAGSRKGVDLRLGDVFRRCRHDYCYRLTYTI